MVEAAGVEPASETTQQEESTRVSSSFGFRSPALRTGKIADPLVRWVSPFTPRLWRRLSCVSTLHIHRTGTSKGNGYL